MGRRRHRPTRNKAPRAVERAIPSTSTPSAATEPTQKTNKGLSLWGGYKTFWAFAGPIVSLLGVYATWGPSITLTGGVNLDPQQTFQTQFVLSNTGNISIYDVTFECALVGESSTMFGFGANADLLSRIPELGPSEPASRGCFERSERFEGSMLRIKASYRWSPLRFSSSLTRHFVARRTPTGTVLLPEAAPNPPLREQVVIRSP